MSSISERKKILRYNKIINAALYDIMGYGKNIDLVMQEFINYKNQVLEEAFKECEPFDVPDVRIHFLQDKNICLEVWSFETDKEYSLRIAPSIQRAVMAADENVERLQKKLEDAIKKRDDLISKVSHLL